MPITACIFDMDGVLLDSEPFWRQAEKEIFANVGWNLTEEDCIRTMGIRTDEIVNSYYAQRPWSGPTTKDVEQQIIHRVADLIKANAVVLPGVLEALDFLRTINIPCALASSSCPFLMELDLEVLKLKEYFPIWYSAANEQYGKPHPAVYLHTAEIMKQHPTNCLAIEDSLNGVIAAKAARMKVIAVPEAQVADDPRFAIADRRIHNLRELPSIWNDIVNLS